MQGRVLKAANKIEEQIDRRMADITYQIRLFSMMPPPPGGEQGGVPLPGTVIGEAGVSIGMGSNGGFKLCRDYWEQPEVSLLKRELDCQVISDKEGAPMSWLGLWF